MLFHSEPNIEGLDIQRNQRWEWPPPLNKKVIKPHPQKMNRGEQEVCNMAFSYLLSQWEGVVWPVLTKHLKSTNILACNSLENKRQWARHPGSWMRKIFIYWTFPDDKTKKVGASTTSYTHWHWDQLLPHHPNCHCLKDLILKKKRTWMVIFRIPLFQNLSLEWVITYFSSVFP